MFWSNVGNYGLEYDPIWGSSLYGLRRLQEEMNRVFESAHQGADENSFPALRMWANSEEALVVALVPGVKPDSLEVSVNGSTLTINGEVESPELKEGERWLRREREQGRFSKVVELPFPVNADRVEAQAKNGVLRVVLPRAEADKPRKIAVH